jgi:chemotaxis signal transduction protein
LSILSQPSIVKIMPRLAEANGTGKSADWFVGVFRWRTGQVSLISFEKMCGEEASARERCYVAVLHALGDLIGLAT